MKKEDAINALMELFEDDEDLFADVVENLDDLTDFLDDDRYRPMDEICEDINRLTPMEAFNLALDGCDEDGGKFDIMADYFRMDYYGSIHSASYRDYTDYLYEWVMEDIIDHSESLDLPSEITDIIDEIDED